MNWHDCPKCRMALPAGSRSQNCFWCGHDLFGVSESPGITIVYTTGRREPKFNWFMDSLIGQLTQHELETIQIMIVDVNAPEFVPKSIRFCPKPTRWQGRYRQTGEDWWAAANARNSGLAACMTGWICFIDDRCVLLPGWFQGLRDAMRERYAVFGSYQKRVGMQVENGEITVEGEITGEDNRVDVLRDAGQPIDAPSDCAGKYCYGCTVALPTGWALKIGGFEEACDGTGFEDVIFGLMMENHGMPMKFDPRMVMIEDRSPEAMASGYRREDKDISPKDKSHRMLEVLGSSYSTTNRAALFQSRKSIIFSGTFPLIYGTSNQDWYDGQPISELA